MPSEGGGGKRKGIILRFHILRAGWGLQEKGVMYNMLVRFILAHCPPLFPSSHLCLRQARDWFCAQTQPDFTRIDYHGRKRSTSGDFIPSFPFLYSLWGMYLRSPRLWSCMIYFKNSIFTFCALCQNVVSDRFCSWNNAFHNFASPLSIHSLNYDIYVYAFSEHPLTWNFCCICLRMGDTSYLVGFYVTLHVVRGPFFYTYIANG